jgi:hypothetical protein
VALIKTIADPQAPGTIDAYAKYARFLVDTLAREISLDVAIYRSQAARDSTDPVYQPIQTLSYRTTDAGTAGPGGPIAGLPTYDQFTAGDNASPDGVGAQIYGILKVTPEFQGAADA